MRKRLRKKKRIGEFREFGVEVFITLHMGVDFDAFLDDFICDAVEANGLAFGGGGCAPQFDGFLELGRQEVLDSDLAIVSAWLAADSRVRTFELGTPVDLWHTV